MSLDYRIEMMLEDEFLRLCDEGVSEEVAMKIVSEMAEGEFGEAHFELDFYEK